MRKPTSSKILVLFTTVCFMLTFLFAAGGQPVAAMSDASVVPIPDTNLRVLIGETIHKPSGDITIGDLKQMEKFDNKGKLVQDFSGLEYATNLQELTLTNTRITSISFVANMTNLRSLNLSDNAITEISHIKNLVNLTDLVLYNNKIQNISALSGLVNVKNLNLELNRIQDISSISNIRNITNLNLESNTISNISPLAKLIFLEKLNLKNNSIKDISPLVQNYQNGGKGFGAQINLTLNELSLGGNSPSGKDIKTLIDNKYTLTCLPQKTIQVQVDGTYLTLDVPPAVVDGRTLVPLRAIFEALNATVDWNSSTRKVTGTKGSTTIVLTINNKQAKVNNQNVMLDVPATIINGRTLVPARFIAESLGKRVEWDNTSRTVLVR